MSTSAIGTQLDAIRAGLVLRSGLSGVNVFSGPVSFEEAGLECIAFGDATLDETFGAMGGNRRETWTVKGEIRKVIKSWASSTEETIKAARDRDLVLFAEIESYINDTYNTGTLPDANITAGELAQGFGPDGRWCSLLFDLQIRAMKNP